MVDLREITGGKKRARTARARADDPFMPLRHAAQMAADVISDMMADEGQFCRHTYADKQSGAVTEVRLETRNVKHLRETIGAIRELTDVVRSLSGVLSPEAQSALNVQLEKLRLDEKKLMNAGESASETGVVLLPEGEGDENA